MTVNVVKSDNIWLVLNKDHNLELTPSSDISWWTRLFSDLKEVITFVTDNSPDASIRTLLEYLIISKLKDKSIEDRHAYCEWAANIAADLHEVLTIGNSEFREPNEEDTKKYLEVTGGYWQYKASIASEGPPE